jgi:hypothetical protein
MLLGIDHLVVAVRSVEAASVVLERDLGLAVTGGGRHEAMGTYNRLAFLGDTYLELIGVFDRDLVASSPSFAVGGAALEQLDSLGEGLATYALAVDDATAEVARLRDAGSPIGGPVPGSRRRADGEVVRWTCAFPELGPGRSPFLIEHEDVGPEWGAEARAARAAFRHPGSGVVRLASLELPVADPAAVTRHYGVVLGIAFGVGWRAAIGPQEVALREGGGEPVVTLTADPGTEPLDLVRFGVRWRRVPRAGG